MSVKVGIYRSKWTLGAQFFDGEPCHLHTQPDNERSENVRVNIDGIWTVLCPSCRSMLVKLLKKPEEAR
jgi:hypothetical protein